MARVEISGLNSLATAIESSVDKIVTDSMNQYHMTARVNTPIKTGNARRNWTKERQENGFEVENRVPYIERLDQGWSRQAPSGIVGPTLTQVKRRGY